MTGVLSEGKTVEINTDRLIKRFMELISIDSLSLKEGKMAERILEIAKEEGFHAEVDNSARKTGGQTGNIFLLAEGEPDVLPLFFSAHIDTVVPGHSKKAEIKGDYIVSKGDTILGADDLAGVVCAFEAVKAIRESGIKHGSIQLVFSVAEEIGLIGAKNMDLSMFKAKIGFVLDHHGKPGRVATMAPSQDKIDFVIEGRSAHAGIEPEKGISAIEVFAHAVSEMKLGRIDFETTANIGMVNGGRASNIVCDRINALAEARSIAPEKLKAQTEHMEKCLREASDKFGARLIINISREYNGFKISENEPVLELFKKATETAGLEFVKEASGGGSDTNIFNASGLKALNIAIGMDKVHTTDERIAVKDLSDTSRLLAAIIAQASIQNNPEVSE